jgi:hypothetical protein
MNYTRPYDEEYKDDPQDWLNGALIFGRALSLLIEEDTGIVVDLKGDAQLSSQPDAKKVVVYRSQGMISIDSMNRDLPEGSFVKIQSEDEQNDRMNNEKMNQMIDEAYENYNKYMTENFMETRWCKVNISPNGKSITGHKCNRDEFISESKRQPGFSERWGLKIEERELSAKERWDWYGENGGPDGEVKFIEHIVYENEKDNQHIHSWLKNFASNVPTKLITITYKNKKTEIYE